MLYKRLSLSTFCIFLLIAVLTSCNEPSEKTADSGKDSTEEYSEVHITPEIDETKYAIQSSILGRVKAVIIEWGKQVSFEGGNELEGNTSVYEGYEGAYVGFSVKYVNFFPDTADSPYNYVNTESMSDFFGRTNDAIYLMNKEKREELLTNYDDVILVRSEHSDKVKVGERALLFMSEVSVLPDLTLDGEAHKSFCYTPSCVGIANGGEPIIFYMENEKLVLEEQFFENFGGETDTVGIVYKLAEINAKLEALGRSGDMLRNGMTTDELDEYFYIVNRHDTFAPLFED